MGVVRVGSGTTHVFHAPMPLSDAATAATIHHQSDVAEAFAIPGVTIAVA